MSNAGASHDSAWTVPPALVQLHLRIPHAPPDEWQSTLQSIPGPEQIRALPAILQCLRRQLQLAGTASGVESPTAEIVRRIVAGHWAAAPEDFALLLPNAVRRAIIAASLAPGGHAALEATPPAVLDALAVSTSTAASGLAPGWDAPHDLAALRQCFCDHLLATHAVLFPTFDPRSPVAFGHVCVAKVHLLRRPAQGPWRDAPAVAAAPWTFFEWVEDDRASQAFLRAHLEHALATLPQVPRDAALPPTVLLVELAPLTAEIAIAGTTGKFEAAELYRRLWALTPHSLSIQGPSLGVAVALAAWAARERRALRPTIATGKIDARGGIGEVAGMAGKLAAVGDFLAVSNRRWHVVVPAAGSLPAASASIVRAAALAELADAARSLLTDGFDDWRHEQQTRPDVTPPAFALGWDRRFSTGQHRSANCAAPSDGAATGGVELPPQEPTVTNLAAIAALVDAFRVADSALPRGAAATMLDTHHVELVALPFGQKPAAIADWLAQAIGRQLMSRTPEEAAEAPVCLPVALGSLPPLTSAALPEALAAALSQAAGRAHVAANALRVALGSAHKLVLLLFEEASLDLCDLPAAAREQRERQRGFFARLARDGDALWSPQRVVALCSDEHHRREWLSTLARHAGSADAT